MIFELSLMGGSLAVMAALYIHQYVVDTRGISSPVEKVKEKMNPLIKDAQAKTNEAIASFNWHSISLLIHEIFVRIAHFFVRASSKTQEVSSLIAEKASQRRENLSKGGAASFYLKQIKDAKNSAENSVE